MSRESLDNKLQLLADELKVMAGMVEVATLGAVEALINKDFESARRIYLADQEINARRFTLENDCIITIATQQPIVARDLRRVASLLDVASEMERMGDYAKGIARICLLIGDQPLIKPLIDIPRMANKTVDMLHRAVAAFIDTDVEAARQIPKEDDEIDDLYTQVYRELVVIMLNDRTTIDQANHLMWAAHNLERMADRVTNICERTIYVATSEMHEIENSDDEVR
jgi:phosphate transport system protein